MLLRKKLFRLQLVKNQYTYRVNLFNRFLAEDTMTNLPIQPDPQQFLALYTTRMPYGKYKDYRLVDLPEPYVVWLHNNGFPAGRLGDMLASVYAIKVDGLEYLFDPLRC